MDNTFAQIVSKEDLVSPIDFESGKMVVDNLIRVQKYLNEMQKEAMDIASLDVFDDDNLSRIKENLAQMPLEYISAAGRERGCDSVEDLHHDIDINNLKCELNHVQEQCSKTTNEIENTIEIIARDAQSISADITNMKMYLELLKNDSKIDSDNKQNSRIQQLENQLEQLKMESVRFEDDKWREICLLMGENFKFEALDLEDRLEKKKEEWQELTMLDNMIKRMDDIGMVEELLSDMKDIMFVDNCIKIRLKTFVPAKGGSLCLYNIESIKEAFPVEHVLKVRLAKESMTFIDAELIPDNVPIDDIVYSFKKARDSMASTVLLELRGQLEWLLREIRFRIFCYSVRHFVLEYDAKSPRNTFQYSERDQIITVHVIGGIKAFIKVPQNWPVSLSPLKLLSLKPLNKYNSDIPLGILCKSLEILNSLELSRRINVLPFIDAIEEILVKELKKSSKVQH